jgi:hypothetical protein
MLEWYTCSIESKIKNETVLAYHLYGDNIVVVIKTNKKNMLFNKLNNFYKTLGFTLENMEKFQLIF